MSAAPCDLSTRIFSLVAYQKREQENLTASLFLIESTHAHTETHIDICMYGFSKNKSLCLCSHGKIWGEGGAKVFASRFLEQAQEWWQESRDKPRQVRDTSERPKDI